MEVSGALEHFNRQPHPGVSLSWLVTGVGPIATTYALTKHLCNNEYDLVLQAGVAGSFNRDIPLGEVVFVASERYGDLGAEDHDKYIDIFDLNLLGENEFPHRNRQLPCDTDLMEPHGLRAVSGLSISTVSGNTDTIARRAHLFGCDIESMEGAAFHFVCLQMKVPFLQIRAISNYVIPRDKSQWKMKDAVIALNNWVIDFVSRQ